MCCEGFTDTGMNLVVYCTEEGMYKLTLKKTGKMPHFLYEARKSHKPDVFLRNLPAGERGKAKMTGPYIKPARRKRR